MRFIILNCLCVDHGYDGRTDRQTHRTAFSNDARGLIRKKIEH